MKTFHKVKLEISRGSGYGQYIISARYKGKDIQVRSTDSQCYDWLNDETDKRLHLDAKRAAYSAIVSAYDRLFF